ncbi:hypothetical protein OIU77_012207 [Salix suchowensis]|uniref:K-box domain-containing protein n=1 Tax=Salix suchowensis TaxID=1278906 RepID=A0ABQ9A2U5_9ROSI|nr:hypothetical protein OIU77_012207 [Salix suchowensis]
MSYRNCTHPENVTCIYLLRRTVVLSNSMEKILERYERCSYAERQSVSPDLDSQGNWTLEYNMLKAKVELLQRNHRHYLGEDLDSVSLKELQNLEQQIDTALKHIRARKNHLMYQSISELQIKERALREQNNMLVKQVAILYHPKTCKLHFNSFQHAMYMRGPFTCSHLAQEVA